MTDDSKPYIDNGQVVLPHSCDEWIIGGRKEVEQMILDLQELLKYPKLRP